MSACTFSPEYSDDEKHADWAGTSIVGDADLDAYFAGPVRDRLVDAEEARTFEDELSSLASTDLGTASVDRIIRSPRQARQPWEVGEAFAECLLRDHADAVWPWNMERDKRTPRASLPGADLVGFVRCQDGARLAIGEVKTSGDVDTPPNVMYGRSGVAHQLERFESDPELQGTVLKWLATRCRDTEYWPDYESAVARFLDSNACEVVLFGVLMRDTSPAVLDLESRGKYLADVGASPTEFRLSAWYLPVSISDWPAKCEAVNNG